MSTKRENKNDTANGTKPLVGRSFTKEEVMNILQNRANNAFGNQKYERNEIIRCIDIINRLMPPSDFPDW